MQSLIFSRQDGFFMGELMDGQRGLVPSNFVEQVPGIVHYNSLYLFTL